MFYWSALQRMGFAGLLLAALWLLAGWAMKGHP